MTGFVVDASVVVKWIVSEPDTEHAVRLLESGAVLIAPELVFSEAANALWALHRRGALTETDYREAIDVLKLAPVGTPVATRDLTPFAARLAVELDHPVYDCLYLALAVQTDYGVVTADRRFHQRVAADARHAERVRLIGEAL